MSIQIAIGLFVGLSVAALTPLLIGKPKARINAADAAPSSSANLQLVQLGSGGSAIQVGRDLNINANTHVRVSGTRNSQDDDLGGELIIAGLICLVVLVTFVRFMPLVVFIGGILIAANLCLSAVFWTPRLRLHRQDRRPARGATYLATFSAMFGMTALIYLAMATYGGTTFDSLRGEVLRAWSSESGFDRWFPINVLSENTPAIVPMAGAVIGLGFAYVAMAGSLLVLFQWFCTIRLASGRSQDSTFLNRQAGHFLSRDWKTTLSALAAVCLVSIALSAGLNLYFNYYVF